MPKTIECRHVASALSTTDPGEIEGHHAIPFQHGSRGRPLRTTHVGLLKYDDGRSSEPALEVAFKDNGVQSFGIDLEDMGRPRFSWLL